MKRKNNSNKNNVVTNNLDITDQTDNTDSNANGYLLYERIKFILILSIWYIFLFFISTYDFSLLHAWYWSHNYRLPPFASGSVSSISSNPFLSSIPWYTYNPINLFPIKLPDETLYDSMHKLQSYYYKDTINPDILLNHMKSLINISILSPMDDSIMMDTSWLRWSVTGSVFSIPENVSKNKDKNSLLRVLLLDIKVNNYKLNVPDGDRMEYILTGQSLEMKIDLATYNLSQGAHEVRVSILMLETPFSDHGNITASACSVFYYIPPELLNATSTTEQIVPQHTKAHTLDSFGMKHSEFVASSDSNDLTRAILNEMTDLAVVTSSMVDVSSDHKLNRIHLNTITPHDYGMNHQYGALFIEDSIPTITFRNKVVPADSAGTSDGDGVIYLTNAKASSTSLNKNDVLNANGYVISLPIDKDDHPRD